MGYRIEFAVGDDLLRAVVTGRASSDSTASWIGKDIADQAKRAARKLLLVDLRRLGNRIGSLGSILMPGGWRRDTDYRVAVVDVAENDPHYVFLELAARSRGYDLRYFDNAAAALAWLQERRDSEA